MDQVKIVLLAPTLCVVFFDSAGPGASDVGIATGPGTAVSATTHGVMTHSILAGYWGAHFVGARRIA